jgi:cation transport ATPase
MALEPMTPVAPAIKTQYTCPMHPQIVRDSPGACPICGMALEPQTVIAEENNPELANMTRRFWVSLILTIPVFALSMSDVFGSFAATGTDVAIQSAGITLIKGDLRGIVKARRLSHAVMSNIRQNLFLAFVYNGIGIPIAAGVLYPFFGLLLSPMIAAAAMSLSSVSVIGNALRLRRLKLD